MKVWSISLSFRSVKSPKRATRYILWLCKSREKVLVLSVIYSYFKDEYTKGVTFLSKMVYRRQGVGSRGGGGALPYKLCWVSKGTEPITREFLVFFWTLCTLERWFGTHFGGTFSAKKRRCLNTCNDCSNKDIRAASQKLPQGTQNHNSLPETRL